MDGGGDMRMAGPLLVVFLLVLVKGDKEQCEAGGQHCQEQGGSGLLRWGSRRIRYKLILSSQDGSDPWGIRGDWRGGG